jgi:tetratricopeptide (TPR) repeat protein
VRLGSTGVLAALAVLVLHAQDQTTGLAGSIIGSWEAVVPDANLTLTNSQTAAELKSTSDKAGEYTFSKIAPGRYDLLVRVTGFKPYARHNLQLKPDPASDGPPRLDVRLIREKEEPLAAIKDLETQAAAKRGDHIAHFTLGRAYFAKGDLENAFKQFQETLKLQPDYRAAKLAEAQVAMRAGATANALQILLDMLNLKPYDGPAILGASAAYQQLGRSDDAAGLLDRFLKNNPFDTDALIHSATVSLLQKHYPEAETAYRRAYDLDPSDPRGLTGMAEVHFAKNEPDKALQTIASEAEKYPQRTDLRRALGAIEIRVNEYDKAIADFQSILDKYKDAPLEQADLYDGIGRAYQGKGDFVRSLENLKKATLLSPDNATYQSTLAGAYDSAGKPKEALECYRQAMKLDPQNAYVMNNAAYFLAKTGGDMDDALRLVQAARRQLPNSDEVQDTLGWVYLKMNLVDSSCQVFQDLIEKVGTNPTFRYHYALALSQKGDKAAALEQLDLALKNKPAKDEETQIKDLIKKLS